VIQVALRGLAGRKLRALLTAIAIVLGVAMVCGTFVLTDTITQSFDRIFTTVYSGTDAFVSGRSAVGKGDQQQVSPLPFSESTLEKVEAVPEVKAALGGVEYDLTTIVDRNGKPVTFGGAPNLGFSIDPSVPEFNSLTLVAGAWPKDGEVVLDEHVEDKAGYKVGDTVAIQADGPIEKLRLSGTIRLAGAAGIGGATMAGFTLPTAQHLFKKEGQLDQIRVAGKPGVSPKALATALRQALPKNVTVRTGQQEADKQASDTAGFISFLRTFLLIFGGVALFVGAFVIANSLSITIAQRTREFATLRTLGASRSQIVLSIGVESLVVGVLASLVGLALGLGLAKGLSALFDKIGFTLPKAGMVVETRTIVASLLVGIVVTLLASLFPALRAIRVAPIAAVREGAVLQPWLSPLVRALVGAALGAMGFALILFALFGHGLSTKAVLFSLGGGAVLVFVGVALFAGKIVRPLSAAVHPIAVVAVMVLSIIVWPLWSLPWWLLRIGIYGGKSVPARIGAFAGGFVLNPFLGVVAIIAAIRNALRPWDRDPLEFPSVFPDMTIDELAADNTRRNPQRTATTAAALMIGLALVTLVSILASSVVGSFTGAVEKIFVADYALTASNNFTPIPTSVADSLRDVPGVKAVTSVRAGEAGAYGKTIQLTGVTEGAAQTMHLDWKDGSDAVYDTLGKDGAFVDDGYADDHQLAVGSPITVLTPRYQILHVTVRGIFKPPSGGSPFGPITISSALFDSAMPSPVDVFSLISMSGGETDANTARLDAALKEFPIAKVQTKQEFIDNQTQGLSVVLNILFVLLAFSVVISFFGIVNTLVLTVFERTREIGMLRAIGMTRRQTRRVIRHESVITSVIGGVLGIALGVVFGILLVSRIKEIDLHFPLMQLVVFGLAAVVVGIVAAILPARRAAKLKPLEALQYE
jgi:putative ABC transport system permease protein